MKSKLFMYSLIIQFITCHDAAYPKCIIALLRFVTKPLCLFVQKYTYISYISFLPKPNLKIGQLTPLLNWFMNVKGTRVINNESNSIIVHLIIK